VGRILFPFRFGQSSTFSALNQISNHQRRSGHGKTAPSRVFVASGGVSLENAADFIKVRVDALGLGGGLIPKSDDEFDRGAALAHKLLEVALKARESR
jgi:2-keto-3-deoxy-6-phosphogluconate aldolase